MSKNNKLKIIVPLILVIIIDTMGVGLFFPVLSPLFMSDNGLLPHASLALRNFSYGLTLGSFSLFMFLSAPILGSISDQVGRKKVLLFCLFGTAISSFLCAFAIITKSIALIILGRSVGGALAGCQPIAQAAIVDISEADEKTKNLGFISLASCLGFIIGPMVGGFFSDNAIASWFNYATPFWADGILALINGVLLWLTLQETFIPNSKIVLNIKQSINMFADAFRHKQVRSLALVLLFYETAWALYFQFIAIYLVQLYHYSSRMIGWYMSFIGLCLGMTFLIIIRLFLKYLRERNIVQFALILCGFSLLLPLIFSSEKGQWWCVIPISIGIGLVWNALLTLFSNVVTEDQQGWVMGVTTSVASMAWIPGVILATFLDYFDPRLPFVFSSIFMFLSFLLLSFNRETAKTILK